MIFLKPKFWSKKNSLISYFLLPLSFFLQFLLIFKNILGKKENFSIPVICIGNLYLGGTGKTPLACEIIRILNNLNTKAAIVRKFYKGHDDEFKLIESKEIKLFKDISRSVAIKKAATEGFECAVLDDGFQDYSINKNLNILCFNEEQLIGNEMTLPSGPLREPFSSVKKSQIVVINGKKNIEFEKKVKNVSNNISIYYAKYQAMNIEKFTNQNLLAFAGIGNTENFFNLIEENNLKIAKKISFPDHYKYSLSELNNLIKMSLENNLKLITTEKDFFRIKHHKLVQIQYLGVKLEIENKINFENEVKNYL
jgi:tetraacyldisaccharide 4'-kinase